MGPPERIGHKSIETDRTPQPFAPAGYFGVQQVRWSPENIANSPEEAPARLFMLPGARYSGPEFSWKFEVAAGGIGFLASRALGPQYRNDLFVGGARSFLEGGHRKPLPRLAVERRGLRDLPQIAELRRGAAAAAPRSSRFEQRTLDVHRAVAPMPCCGAASSAVASVSQASTLDRMRVTASLLLALVYLAVLASSLVGCAVRSPACSGGTSAPIDPAVVASSLERKGFEMRNLTRSGECSADDIVATLEDDEEGLTVRCVVREAPIYMTGRVIRLVNSPDGATHLAAANVECFVTADAGDRDQVVADVRAGLTLMLQLGR